MFLLFLIVVMTTPQLLNSVLEEKMSRISEVLLGSVTPFELMLGKLLAQHRRLGGDDAGLPRRAARGRRIAGATRCGRSAADRLVRLVPLLAVLIYGSMFIAIGSACSDLKRRAEPDDAGDDDR